jgi:hypothetical protein
MSMPSEVEEAIAGGCIEFVEHYMCLYEYEYNEDILILAAKHGHLILIQHFVGNQRFVPGFLPFRALEEAVKNNHLEVVKYFIGSGIDGNLDSDIMAIATAAGHTDIIAYLINVGYLPYDADQKTSKDVIKDTIKDTVETESSQDKIKILVE